MDPRHALLGGDFSARPTNLSVASSVRVSVRWDDRAIQKVQGMLLLARQKSGTQTFLYEKIKIRMHIMYA
jgi:hypothetical protein